MPTKVDILIVGGGLSGLALAQQLTAPKFSHLSVCVLEAKESYQRDRTWSYWRSEDTPYHHLERKRWTRWSVSREDEQKICEPDPASALQYCSIDADAFYSEVLAIIRQSAHVKLLMGTSVQSIHSTDPSHLTNPLVVVDTAAGEQFLAQWVFDARPPDITKIAVEKNLKELSPPLAQQFMGWEIKTEHDVFDPDCVNLMDFKLSAHGLHFFYVLPYSTRNALVESTWVCPATYQPNYVQELRQYLLQRFDLTSFETSYQEYGVLNLQQSNFKPIRFVCALGRAAGTLRPATGYAFLDTVAHSRAIAEALACHPKNKSLALWAPPPFKRAALDCWMDRVFLKVLQSDWLTSSTYFMQLFSRVPPEPLIAFLSGRASLRQRIQIARSLPKWRFIKAAFSDQRSQGSSS